MHASVDQLLTLRDGAPLDAAVATHVHACGQCSAELAQLSAVTARLRLLGRPTPGDARDADAGWTRVQSALARPARRPVPLARVAAVAAAVVWAAIGLVWFGGSPRDPSPRVASEVTPGSPNVEVLLVESRDLENTLLALPRRPSVETAALALTLDALEARLQLLDYTLSRSAADGASQAQVAALWQHRVDLLESLVALRYVQATRQTF